MRDAKKGPSTSELFQSKQLNSAYLWSVCAYSDRPLEEPIVSDYRGRLYCKEDIIEMLLGRAAGKETKHAQVVVPHITSLKRDVVELIFSKDSKGTWICPLTQKEILQENKGSKFVYLAGCGHVFSEKGYKELDFTSCYLCDKEIDKEAGIVIINPTSEADAEQLEKRMSELKERGLSHSLASASGKKRKHDKTDKTDKKHKSSSSKKKKISGSKDESERIPAPSEAAPATPVAS